MSLIQKQLASPRVLTPPHNKTSLTTSPLSPLSPTPPSLPSPQHCQVLNIATKINKGTIEIVQDVQVCREGEKVGASEATLLSKLGIKPFQVCCFATYWCCLTLVHVLCACEFAWCLALLNILCCLLSHISPHVSHFSTSPPPHLSSTAW